MLSWFILWQHSWSCTYCVSHLHVMAAHNKKKKVIDTIMWLLAHWNPTNALKEGAHQDSNLIFSNVSQLTLALTFVLWGALCFVFFSGY